MANNELKSGAYTIKLTYEFHREDETKVIGDIKVDEDGNITGKCYDCGTIIESEVKGKLNKGESGLVLELENPVRSGITRFFRFEQNDVNAGLELAMNGKFAYSKNALAKDIKTHIPENAQLVLSKEYNLKLLKEVSQEDKDNPKQAKFELVKEKSLTERLSGQQ